jgi:ADP-ribose pyrophosphatase YjhB (NUDIX family)
MSRLVLRVYGLLIHEGRILLADEIIRGRRITKFPGGGLEYGEGTKDCLIREIREELGVEALDLEHFYTTDFFQRSVFHDDDVQVVSVHYTFKVNAPAALKTTAGPFAFAEEKEGAEAFRWLDLAHAKEEDVTLPIDRVVMRMLLRR